MRIVIFTIGSRGDVQPYVALAKGLRSAGHPVTVATHEEFEELVTTYGVGFVRIGGDVREMLESQSGQAWLRSGYNPVKFAKQFMNILEPFKKGFLSESLDVCQHAEAIIYSTLSFPVYHVAEALDVPCFYAPLQPMSRTREIPYIQLAGSFTLGRAANWWTHIISEQLFWQPLRPDVNMWRVNTLGLPRESFFGPFSKVYKNEFPFLYGFSESVFSKPGDWPAWHYITGYWFLNGRDWKPDPRLVTFLENGSAPVYIGFGSMVVYDDPNAFVELILNAVKRSGQRVVLQKGWNHWQTHGLPDWVFPVDYIPHDWLFPRMSAVIHHGGAGTTAAGLRAGVPTVTVPFFADQPFWGSRVAALGAGCKPIPPTQLSAIRLAHAIRTATTDEDMKTCAAAIGSKLRNEDGVARAINIINRYL